MTERDYRDYLQDMLDSINEIEDFVGDLSFEEFRRDRKTINAVVRVSRFWERLQRGFLGR